MHFKRKSYSTPLARLISRSAVILMGAMGLVAGNAGAVETTAGHAPSTLTIPASERSAAAQPAQRKGSSEQLPIHVRIVQNPDDAANDISHMEREKEDLKAQIRSANAAENQVVLTGWSLGLSVLGTLALLCTIWLTRASVRQATRAADAANANIDSFISAERAYVKMSILDPGVQWHNDDRQFYVTVRIENFGHTPATVTDTRIWASIRSHDDLLPTPFPYPPRKEEARHTGFLVPGDDFSFEKHFPISPSSPRHDSSKRLWVFGHVDYIALDRRFRYGFARLYEPALDGGLSNIMRVTEGRYDFDRERTKDEGDDWQSLITTL